MSQTNVYDSGADAEAWLTSVVENSDDAIISKTLDGIIISWNTGAEKIFGHSRIEAIGQLIKLIIPEDRLHEEDEIIAKLRSGKRVERFETVRRRSDGTPVYVEVTVSPVFGSAGRIIGASKIARDIGERKRHLEEQVLLAREMQHRVKNLLSIVKGLITICRRKADSVNDFADELGDRIVALGAAQELVLQQPENSKATLSEVIEAVLAPYRDDASVRVEASDAIVGPRSSTSLALLLHELATNAVKYGGLSDSSGQLIISISEGDGTVLIDWREKNAMNDSGEEGFGTELQRIALQGLGGSAEKRWDSGERAVMISLPRAQLST